VYYDQKQSDKPERNIWGRASITVRPEHFKASSFLGSEGYYQLTFNDSAKVTDAALKSFNVTMNLNNTVLAFATGTYTPANNGYESKSQLASYGVNLLGTYAPFNVQAWEALSSTNTITPSPIIAPGKTDTYSPSHTFSPIITPFFEDNLRKTGGSAGLD
jgi:hypothetical protein